MRAPHQDILTSTESPDAVFQAALGVVQNAKGTSILAVHTGGRKLVARQKGKFSNPKLFQLQVGPLCLPSWCTLCCACAVLAPREAWHNR